MIIISIFQNCLKTTPIVHEDLILKLLGKIFWNSDVDIGLPPSADECSLSLNDSQRLQQMWGQMADNFPLEEIVTEKIARIMTGLAPEFIHMRRYRTERHQAWQATRRRWELNYLVFMKKIFMFQQPK